MPPANRKHPPGALLRTVCRVVLRPPSKRIGRLVNSVGVIGHRVEDGGTPRHRLDPETCIDRVQEILMTQPGCRLPCSRLDRIVSRYTAKPHTDELEAELL